MGTTGFSNAAVPPRLVVLAIVVVLAALLPSASCYPVRALDTLQSMGRFYLATAVGPESLAFDGHGSGPYTGVSGGSILVWQGEDRGWARYAVTSSNWRRSECDGVGGGLITPPESVCGRPLGLQFHKASGVLYVADAYLGLLAVDPGGGEARVIAAAADGGAFSFVNGLDVDQRTGVVYFTDSSTWLRRWEYTVAVISGDSTGRLVQYDPRTNKVTVLLHGLPYPNGVAVSGNGGFVLFGETGKCRIMRHWLRGPKGGSTEVFAELPGYPDNIRRTPGGDYWVALNPERADVWWRNRAEHLVGVRVSGAGEVVEALDGRRMATVSEVDERDGVLWIGSVDVPYVEAFKL